MKWLNFIFVSGTIYLAGINPAQAGLILNTSLDTYSSVSTTEDHFLFNKKLDTKKLSDFIHMPMTQKLQQVATDGIKIIYFKKPLSPITNPYINENLFPSINTENAGPLKMHLDSNLLGLFLSREDNLNSYGAPIMILANDSDEWTFIHEYMHYLFNEYRLNQKISSREKAEDLKNLIEDFNEKNQIYSDRKTSENLINLITIYLELVDVSLDQISYFDLEEVVIEIYLHQNIDPHYFDHTIHFPNNHTLNYLKKNLESARHKISFLILNNEFLKTEIAERSDVKKSYEKILNQKQFLLYSFMEEIQKINFNR